MFQNMCYQKRIVKMVKYAKEKYTKVNIYKCRLYLLQVISSLEGGGHCPCSLLATVWELVMSNCYKQKVFPVADFKINNPATKVSAFTAARRILKNVIDNLQYNWYITPLRYERYFPRCDAHALILKAKLPLFRVYWSVNYESSWSCVE